MCRFSEKKNPLNPYKKRVESFPPACKMIKTMEIENEEEINMKKARHLLPFVLSALLAGSLLAGCGGGAGSSAGTGQSSSAADAGPSSAADDAKGEAPFGGPIRIAVAAPMTGDNAEYGIGFYQAALLKAKEWNDRGGVLGRPIEILQYDDKNNAEEAATIAQKIAAEKDIAAVIGHFSSGVSMTAAPTYQENKIVEISPSASHPDYSGLGDYIFRNNTVISKEGAASVDIAVNDLGKKKVGILSIITDWGTSTAGIIKELVVQADAQVVGHEEVMEGSDDYTPAITKLREAGAEVIICCGMYNLVASVSKQYKAVDPQIEIVGFSNAYSQQLLELGGEAVEGVSFPVVFFSESEDPEIKDYVERYTKEYGSAPSALTSQAYDSVGLVLTAIERSGSADPEVIKTTLYELEYPGVTGLTRFDERGDVDKDFVKVTIENGKFVPFR